MVWLENFVELITCISLRHTFLHPLDPGAGLLQALAALQPYSFPINSAMATGIHFQGNQSIVFPMEVKTDIQRGAMQKVSIDVSWRMEQGQQHRAGLAHRDVGFEHSP